MLKRHFLHIDGSQIKKLAWLLYTKCMKNDPMYHLNNLNSILNLKIGWKLKKSKFGDTLLPLSRDKISKLKTFHGNRLHLGGRVLEILHLDAETEPWRLADPKITRFENRIILPKIDLKWLKNGRGWIFLT